MKVFLLNPPVSDPTCPYSSLYHLKGNIEKKSHHTIMIKDTNIEWLDYLINHNYTDKLLANVESMKDRFEKKDKLTTLEYLHYCKLVDTHIITNNSEVKDAVAILRDNTYFYQMDYYFQALTILKKWTRLLSAVAFPANFYNFRYDFGIFRNRSSVEDLLKPITNKESGFYCDYVENVLIPYLYEEVPDVIGISVPFKYQIYYALIIVRILRNKFPNTKFILGGTCVHQMYKNTVNNGELNKLYELLSLFDVTFIGEGEEPLIHLLDYWESNKGIEDIPNIIRLDRDRNQVLPVTNIYYHDLEKLPAPDYSDVNWKLYFSPERYISYAPTRGCYWGKCSFCDYGLSIGKGTTKWREKNIEVTIRDIIELKKYSDFIYFSVDALSPRWLLALAERLVELEINIYWGAEMRIDKMYTIEEALLLKQSGCTAVSIGIESASERIVKQINKGILPYKYNEALINLAKVGIAIYPMTFLGFPGEDREDIEKTLQFLYDYKNEFALIPSPSTFYLEGTSDVSINHTNYDIVNKEKFSNLDIIDGWYWRGSNYVDYSIEDKYHDLCTEVDFIMERPFLGVDTPHSMMYVAKYDRYILKEMHKKLISKINHDKNNIYSNISLQNVYKAIEYMNQEANKFYEQRLCPTGVIMDKIMNEIEIDGKMKKEIWQEYDSKALDKLEKWYMKNYSRNREINYK